MACLCCKTARENPAWYFFYPTCKYCSARNIKMLDAMTAIDIETRRTRKTAVLKAAIEQGHDEMEVRRLHAHGPYTEPQAKSVAKPADGMIRQVDMLKALGNGQVPLQAAAAWWLLGDQ